MDFVQCVRCGITWEPGDRKKTKLCESCRTRRSHQVKDCIPHQGWFASDMVTPINENGEIVLPGVRLCGNSDCINPGHIVAIT